MNPDHTEKEIAPLMAAIGKITEQIILFGAGATGRQALKFLRSKGIEPVAFADNGRGSRTFDGLPVYAPYAAKYDFPNATWVACAISRPAATEIRAQMKEMGVKTKPLWECLLVCHGLPSDRARTSIASICGDAESILTLNDQCIFRRNPDYEEQDAPSDIKDIYFPNFIKKLDRGEHFVDCGAGMGETVEAFIDRWPSWSRITAFEPDIQNYRKLSASVFGNVHLYQNAVADCIADVPFSANADFSSNINADGQDTVRCVPLDGVLKLDHPPTYIKMDIEGFELEALWGARRTLKEHKPVLAVCAYHKSDHLYEIPLLIHAIQPEYKLFFRRYAEGAWEIIWYAVPPERVA